MSCHRIRSSIHDKALALIVVVYILAVLGTLAFALAFRSQVGLCQVELLMDRTQHDAVAWAACVQARQLLAADDPNVDSPDEAWSGWHALEMPRGSGNAASSRVWWRLVDESAKINVNQVSADILSRIEGLDSAEVASILDWIDEDNIPNPDGAEEEYYTNLSPGYSCRNGPLESVEELTLIKGITANLYFGAGEPETPEELGDLPPAQAHATVHDDDSPGLHELLTIYGDGRINLNTARRSTLEALPFLSDSATSEILSRQESATRKFATLEDIETTEVFDLTEKIVLGRVAKFSSNHFQLQIRGQFESAPSLLEYTALLERDEKGVRLINWQRKLPRTGADDLYSTTDHDEMTGSRN